MADRDSSVPPRAMLSDPVRLAFSLLDCACGPSIERRGLKAPMEDHRVEEFTGQTEQQKSVLAEISREMVRIYKEQFGRGPTKARTAFAGPDTVISTLEHSLTPVEKRLVELGEHQRLRDVRLFFQHATEAEFRGTIERLLEREVRAFVSGMDVEGDVSDEIFHLVPIEPD